MNMLPWARVVDNVCAVFVALLPTLALTFGANALIGDGCLVPADPVPVIAQSEPTLPPPLDASRSNESIDAAVSAATLILQLDNVEIEWDILDRMEQCCPYHTHHMRRSGPRWREDW